MARLADAQCHGLFVFVAGGDEGAGVAFIEQVVVVVTELAAQTVFGVVAEAEFELVLFHFRHGYFYRHAVAFQTVEIGLHGRAGIVAVLLQSLLVVEQFVQIVRRTCVELRQSAHDADGIAFVAADFKFAEVNRPPAVHRYRQVGLMFGRVYRGLGGGKLGQRVFFPPYCRQNRTFAAAPFFLAECRAHRQAPVFHRRTVIRAQIFVLQHIAQNGDADVVDFGLRPAVYAYQIAYAFAADGYFAVEVAFGFQHGQHLFGGFFRQKLHLFGIQLFFQLLRNQRQVFLQHFFYVGRLRLDAYRIFLLENGRGFVAFWT